MNVSLHVFHSQRKQKKVLLRKLDPNDKQYQEKRGNLQRLRMGLSMKNAGHTKSGHSFH